MLLNLKSKFVSKIADVGIPETPTPLASANVGNRETPPPLKHADVLNGWSLIVFTSNHFFLPAWFEVIETRLLTLTKFEACDSPAAR